MALRILMTLFNKFGREFNVWIDKILDGWRETIPLASVYILSGFIFFGGIIVFSAWYQDYL